MILLFCPDNDVTLWMFSIESLTPTRQEAPLVEGNTLPMSGVDQVPRALDRKTGLLDIGSIIAMIAKAHCAADVVRRCPGYGDQRAHRSPVDRSML